MKWLIAIAVIVVVLAVAVVFRARKLDNLNRAVTRSRRVLENALNERAHAALTAAQSGQLDIAGAMVLADAATNVLDATMFPIVDDGLDAISIDGAQPPTSANRLALESELSRALRLTVDELDTSIAPLEQARDRVRMARRFHNSKVSRARKVRGNLLVRVFHLHGSAPAPVTVDIDDE
ncbi:hypothetical protein J2S49_000145 [Arcanobacterium wilhelmae]|uniref:LemA family protein n=1 Tax=Arcanobacterium wilhelmae TaxID=1803177 RepID=A0ABT9N8P1_9ACTO|nr:hypothetical protein [Arcanobacterium wilhelmae]MDP9800069.1 hypothetical protein [Arcanobacterium wilhelmae]WFN89564.1 hypothetical protein P8A24_04955 [Arcanobacterium wilhelmae]